VPVLPQGKVVFVQWKTMCYHSFVWHWE